MAAWGADFQPSFTDAARFRMQILVLLGASITPCRFLVSVPTVTSRAINHVLLNRFGYCLTRHSSSSKWSQKATVTWADCMLVATLYFRTPTNPERVVARPRNCSHRLQRFGADFEASITNEPVRRGTRERCISRLRTEPSEDVQSCTDLLRALSMPAPRLCLDSGNRACDHAISCPTSC